MKLLFYLLVFTPTMAFKCYQCNSGINEKGWEPCVDKEIKCPEGTESCSVMMYVSAKDQEIYMRKFCTSPGTPMVRYLRIMPRGGKCQSIFMVSFNLIYLNIFMVVIRRREALPPAPPSYYVRGLF
ncbi:unnamed protein product [Thelazia callipaeda]|uniref:UPAR/Ly6 domain-containing protein n=1 Tax=Thelazia callipaeda TaxID=103827 RepID=A0A0N5CT40_THECL|nr:unnamed protein product [Thelazia callipaeda]